MRFKCKYCESVWETKTKVDVCPFCGKTLNEQSRKINSLDDGISTIVEDFGLEIILDSKRFYSLILDCVLGCEKEKQLLKIALNIGVNDDLIRALNGDEILRETTIKQSIHHLEEKAFISHENAEYIVMLFSRGLGIIITEENCSNNDAIERDADNEDSIKPLAFEAQYEIESLISKGMIINAIKVYREATSASLSEAKEYVDNLALAMQSDKSSNATSIQKTVCPICGYTSDSKIEQCPVCNYAFAKSSKEKQSSKLEVISTGSTIEEARNKAAKDLKERFEVNPQDEIKFEIVQAPQRGLFRRCDAQVRAILIKH